MSAIALAEQNDAEFASIFGPDNSGRTIDLELHGSQLTVRIKIEKDWNHPARALRAGNRHEMKWLEIPQCISRVESQRFLINFLDFSSQFCTIYDHNPS